MIRFALRIDRRNVVAGARGPVDETEDRIVPVARLEPRLHARRTDSPSGLRLVATETRALIGAEIGEESVLRSLGCAARLKRRDRPESIGIDLESGNDRRRRLLAVVAVEKRPHPLRVSDGSRLPRMFRGVVGTTLRTCDGCDAASSTQQRGHCDGILEGEPRSLRYLEK